MVKKIPQRMCLGCQDTTGKKNGRGAYICPDKACLEAVIKSKRLEKSLETEISEEVYNKLREQLS